MAILPEKQRFDWCGIKITSELYPENARNELKRYIANNSFVRGNWEVHTNHTPAPVTKVRHSDVNYIQKYKAKFPPEAYKWTYTKTHEMVWIDDYSNIFDDSHENRKAVKPDEGIFS